MNSIFRFFLLILIVSGIHGIMGCGSSPLGDNGFNGAPTDGFTLYFDTDGLADNFVNDIAVDLFRSGVWIATERGASFHSFADSTWTSYGPEEGFPSLRITSLAISLTTVWAGTISGPAFFDNGVWREIPDPGVFPNPFINTIASMPEPDHSIWFGTRGGAVRRSLGGEWRAFTVQDGLARNDVSSIARDVNGDIWAGTEFSVNIFDGNRWTSFFTPLPNALVRTLYSDSFGSMWAGTSAAAIEYRRGEQIIYGTLHGLPSPSINDFVEDFNRVLWAATDQGIAWFDGVVWRQFTLPGAVVGLPVTSLASDPITSSLWIGTTSGLVRYQPPAR